jgi:hypothetical protein
VAFIPFLIYLAVSAVYRFGFEKNVGAMELVMYGPADGTSCFLAFILRNLLFTVLYGAVLLLFFWITALASNLVLGPQFFYALAMMFFLALVVYAYGALTSVVSANSSVGTALFAGILIFLILIQMGSFTIVSGYVKSLSSLVASIVKWVSPLFYWNTGLSSMDFGFVGGFLLNMLYLVVLTAALLVLSHFIVKTKGVRE